MVATRFARFRRARDRHEALMVATRFARFRRARDRHEALMVATRFARLRRARDRHEALMVATRFARLRRARDRHEALMVATRFARLRRARDHHEVDRRFHSLPAWVVVTSDGYAGIREGGPYFDDLAVGQVFDWAPSMTLSSGLAGAHQAIVGDRLRLALDADLCGAVTGLPAPLAHPGLVCDVAIGQSTLVTQRVKANLFYRGLVFHRFPVIGDSLYTRTEVVGLRANSPKPGRAPTGLAALRMITIDQADQLVLDFYRCGMLPASPDFAPDNAPHDDLSAIGIDVPGPAHDPTAQWDGAVFREKVPGPHFGAGLAGSALRSTADVVSSAPELARLTLNIAATHHDSRVGGRRLVYGGHTIGLALAQASRLLPNLVTVLNWQSCDHTGPVHEGDTLYSELHIETAEPTDHGGVLGLRSLVYAVSDTAGEPDRPVLDWRFHALQF